MFIGLKDFVDEAAIEALRRPTGEATGLPGAVYLERFYELERKALFPKTWAAVAVGAELPEPGDLLPVELAGWPLLLVRGKDRTIRCFYNICRHRGMRLADAPCRAGARITCPWHAWSYDLEGRLMATPNLGGMGVNEAGTFDRSTLGLKPVRCANWLDFVFVNIDGQAPPIESYLDALITRIANYDLSTLEFGGASSADYEANWKFVAEGAMEDYHLPWGHPDLQKGVLRRDVVIETDGRAYTSMTGKQTYDDQADLSPGYARHLPPLPNLPDDAKGVTFIANIFPTAILTLEGDHVQKILLQPLDWNRTRLVFNYYYPPDTLADPAYEEGRRQVREAWEQVIEEDAKFVKQVQANAAVRDGIGTSTRFSPYWETAVQHFQRIVIDTIQKDDP